MDIKIVISGAAGSGKSGIAQRIKQVLELDGIAVVTAPDAEAPRLGEDMGRFLKTFAERGSVVFVEEQSVSSSLSAQYDRAMGEAFAVGEQLVNATENWRDLACHPTAPLAWRLYRKKYETDLNEAYTAVKVALHNSTNPFPRFPVVVKYDDRLYPETVSSSKELRDVDFRLVLT